MPPAPREVLEALWRRAGLPPAALGPVVPTGGEPAMPSSFRIAADIERNAAAIKAAGIEMQ